MLSHRVANLIPKPLPPPALEPVDLNTWDDGEIWGDKFYVDTQPIVLDEPWPFRFKWGEKVWVCASDGNWYLGKVVGQAMCGKIFSEPEMLYWWVEYKVGPHRVRKWLAPLRGEIKPDDENTYKLLGHAGLLG